MKYIFLDIDGVFNHLDFYNEGLEEGQTYLEWRNSVHYPFSEFDPRVVKRVCEVIEATGARVVISSSWRIGDDGTLKNVFEKIGMPTDFDVTPNLMFDPTKTSDERNRLCRGDEIKLFMDDKSVESYCIIDDDEEMLPEQQDSFVKCNFLHGFTDEDKNKAISILNKK